MKMRTLCTIGAVVLLLETSLSAQNPHWVAAYWPGWELGDGVSNLSPPFSAIEWSAFTEIMYFSLTPTFTGGLDSTLNGMNYIAARRLIDSAHTHGVKVLFTVGGAGTESQFMAATSSANLPAFIRSLIDYMKRMGFDGIDIDWEALNTTDLSNFRELAAGLRAGIGPNAILTNTGGNPAVNAATQDFFDQINLCTYDMTGPYGGWVTWYNGSVYSWGKAASNGEESFAAVDPLINEYIRAGVSPMKLGIGSEFGGTIWKGGTVTDSVGIPQAGTNGATGANEGYSTPPKLSFDAPLYWQDGTGIMQKYYRPQYYHWDDAAKAAYLSIDSTGNSNDYFISFDDSNSLKAKFNYVKSKGIGGLILWTLKMGYPGLGRYPLLQTLKELRQGGKN